MYVKRDNMKPRRVYGGSVWVDEEDNDAIFQIVAGRSINTRLDESGNSYIVVLS